MAAMVIKGIYRGNNLIQPTKCTAVIEFLAVKKAS